MNFSFGSIFIYENYSTARNACRPLNMTFASYIICGLFGSILAGCRGNVTISRCRLMLPVLALSVLDTFKIANALRISTAGSKFNSVSWNWVKFRARS